MLDWRPIADMPGEPGPVAITDGEGHYAAVASAEEWLGPMPRCDRVWSVIEDGRQWDATHWMPLTSPDG